MILLLVLYLLILVFLRMYLYRIRVLHGFCRNSRYNAMHTFMTGIPTLTEVFIIAILQRHKVIY